MPELLQTAQNTSREPMQISGGVSLTGARTGQCWQVNCVPGAKMPVVGSRVLHAVLDLVNCRLVIYRLVICFVGHLDTFINADRCWTSGHMWRSSQERCALHAPYSS